MAQHFIGADVDSQYVDLAVERNQKIVKRFRVPTTIPALRAVLEQVAGTKELTFEEGPMAHWLYRNLKDAVDRIVVCDPRRNAYIAKDGDKDDPIDAAKLAALLRGGFLREVHHSDDDQQVLFKQWIGLYHDRVREAVRQVNKLRGRCRMYGIKPAPGAIRDPERREEWLAKLGKSPLAAQLQLLWMGYDSAAEQVKLARRQVSRMSKRYPIIALWGALPGVGLIRASTLYAYLDTPWRFAGNPHKLWKYCGIGLERCSSGKDRKGKPKIGMLQLAWAVNRRLKDAVMGAAQSALNQGRNVFAWQYERLVADGVSPGNARHTVARKMLSVMWGMWKTGRRFDETLVGPAGSSDQATVKARRQRRTAREWYEPRRSS
jgi:transposase